MKKFYFLLCAVFFYGTTTIYAQNPYWINENGGDYLWTNNNNWWNSDNGNMMPVNNADAEVIVANSSGGNSIVDTDHPYFTIKRLSNNINRPGGNIYFGNTTSSSNAFSSTGTIEIDIQENLDPGTSIVSTPANYAIHHQSSTALNFNFDGNITIENSLSSRSVLRVSGHADNEMIFRRNSVLNLIGTQNTISYAEFSTAEIKFNGTITGDQTLQIGKGTTSFGTTADNSGHTGNIQFIEEANVTVIGGTGGPIFMDGSNGSVLSIGGDGTNVSLTLNEPNTVQGGADLYVRKNNILTMNVNESQNGFGALDFRADSSNGTLNLAMATGKSIEFDNSSAQGWDLGTVSITGFVSGSSVRFGTDASGITAAQLAKITTTPGPGTNEKLIIDSNGWLKFESTLGVENHNAFEFTVYPNPAKDVLKINTQQQLQKVEIADLLGRTVFKQHNVSGSVDISTLNKGIYILKLTSEKGISTKKIIKE